MIDILSAMKNHKSLKLKGDMEVIGSNIITLDYRHSIIDALVEFADDGVDSSSTTDTVSYSFSEHRNVLAIQWNVSSPRKIRWDVECEK